MNPIEDVKKTLVAQSKSGHLTTFFGRATASP
ncbi:hypothetical protein P872_06540 [Rhodonellum psychrophilum GCM71 = DSM 17998]|uniref:Uncharacterized protein n=1 Tax=Rhodonellum psychrophilum GCM71 = DSM 17998 TaxID=1123057 RepID=U5BQ18_9BACT|nr:hypothetical protein P872_06540 [Rhodonellum psychrophilum GCM71 = DSM 17998]